MNILKKFIDNNDLVIGPGSRNTPLTALCGFALYKNLTVEDVKHAINTDDVVTNKEAERVFDYAKLKNYNKWWEIEENRKMYVIE